MDSQSKCWHWIGDALWVSRDNEWLTSDDPYCIQKADYWLYKADAIAVSGDVTKMVAISAQSNIQVYEWMDKPVESDLSDVPSCKEVKATDSDDSVTKIALIVVCVVCGILAIVLCYSCTVIKELKLESGKVPLALEGVETTSNDGEKQIAVEVSE